MSHINPSFLDGTTVCATKHDADPLDGDSRHPLPNLKPAPSKKRKNLMSLTPHFRDMSYYPSNIPISPMSGYIKMPPAIDEEATGTTQPRLRPLAVRWSLIPLKFLLSQWQILGIGIAVLLAWLFPNIGRRGGVIESQYDFFCDIGLINRYTISYGAIGIIFLISGFSIPRQALIDNCTKFRLHFVVQITSYLVIILVDLSDPRYSLLLCLDLCQPSTRRGQRRSTE